MFRKLSAVVLLVSDFDSSLRFYRDTLGLTISLLEEKFAAFEMLDHQFALQHTSLAGGHFGAAVEKEHASPAEPPARDRAMLCAQVEDVDAIYEKLRASGVRIAKPPTDQYWGIRAIYFYDPEGNFWEFWQPLAQ